MSELTQEKLKELITYNSDTGIFTWKPRSRCYFKTDRAEKMWNNRYPGTEAGSIDSAGYMQTCIFGKGYRLHRIAWLYVHGDWPSNHIDHINGIKNDNRICNIREVKPHINSRNHKLHKDNTSGYNGVYSYLDRWRARIYVRGKQIHLGTFRDINDAVKARKEADIKYKFSKYHGELR